MRKYIFLLLVPSLFVGFLFTPSNSQYVSETYLGVYELYAEIVTLGGSSTDSLTINADSNFVNSVSVGNGTDLDSFLMDTITVNSGDTVATATISGVTTSHLVFAQFNSGNTGNASITKAAPGTNQVVLTFGDPQTTSTIAISAIKED